MNLTSCNKCGVVLDKDKLHFADDIYKESGEVDERLAAYNQSTDFWDSFVSCPVCGYEVFK